MIGKGYGYSKAELAIFEHFGIAHIAHLVCPIELYRMTAIIAFETEDRTPYADALRRCLDAVKNESTRRLTKEFDDLANIEEPAR